MPVVPVPCPRTRRHLPGVGDDRVGPVGGNTSASARLATGGPGIDAAVETTTRVLRKWLVYVPESG